MTRDGPQTVGDPILKVLTGATCACVIADAAEDRVLVSDLTDDEIKALRAIAREPQPYTLGTAIRAVVHKGYGRIAEGRGVVLTRKGEELLMTLPPE